MRMAVDGRAGLEQTQPTRANGRTQSGLTDRLDLSFTVFAFSDLSEDVHLTIVLPAMSRAFASPRISTARPVSISENQTNQHLFDLVHTQIGEMELIRARIFQLEQTHTAMRQK